MKNERTGYVPVIYLLSPLCTNTSQSSISESASKLFKNRDASALAPEDLVSTYGDGSGREASVFKKSPQMILMCGQGREPLFYMYKHNSDHMNAACWPPWGWREVGHSLYENKMTWISSLKKL